MAPVNRKISAASARAHTRRRNQASSSSFSLPSGILNKITVVILVGLLALLYQAIQPPAPKICGSSNGPPVTSSRIKLKDGRHLSYLETGVSKEKAMHKIIFLHGMSSCKLSAFPISQEVMDKFGIYMLAFDRPGYGESDPDPHRSVKSNCHDIEELADQLELGPKFFVMGFSLGGELVWGCLKYISHRVAGAAIVAPPSNFWWPNFPSNVSKDVFSQQLIEDQWAYRVAHYVPWLTYWWNTQKLFPCSRILANRVELLSDHDKEIFPKLTSWDLCKTQATQQGEFESRFRDWNIAFGKWDFDPMDLENPFPYNEGSVHLWHGTDDQFALASLSRCIAEKLPWVRYHEIPGVGHFFPVADGASDPIVTALVVGDQ